MIGNSKDWPTVVGIADCRHLGDEYRTLSDLEGSVLQGANAGSWGKAASRNYRHEWQVWDKPVVVYTPANNQRMADS